MATQIPKPIRKVQSNEVIEVKTKRPAPKQPKDIPTSSKKVSQTLFKYLSSLKFKF